MIVRHALYVASLDEEKSTWLERLDPLRRLGLERLDVTAVLAPDEFWRSVPARVQESVMSRTRSPVIKHLWQLMSDVHRHGLDGQILLDGLPSHERALSTATSAQEDLLIVALPARPPETTSGFLDSSVPVLLLRGGSRLDTQHPTLVLWNHPLECSAMLDVVQRMAEAELVPPKVQLLRCGGDTGREDTFGVVAAAALHERLQANGFEVHSSWAAGAAAAAALDAVCGTRSGLVIVSRPERRGPHDPWDRTIVERFAEDSVGPVLILPSMAGALEDDAGQQASEQGA